MYPASINPSAAPIIIYQERTRPSAFARFVGFIISLVSAFVFVVSVLSVGVYLTTPKSAIDRFTSDVAQAGNKLFDECRRANMPEAMENETVNVHFTVETPYVEEIIEEEEGEEVKEYSVAEPEESEESKETQEEAKAESSVQAEESASENVLDGFEVIENVENPTTVNQTQPEEIVFNSPPAYEDVVLTKPASSGSVRRALLISLLFVIVALLGTAMYVVVCGFVDVDLLQAQFEGMKDAVVPFFTELAADIKEKASSAYAYIVSFDYQAMYESIVQFGGEVVESIVDNGRTAYQFVSGLVQDAFQSAKECFGYVSEQVKSLFQSQEALVDEPLPVEMVDMSDVSSTPVDMVDVIEDAAVMPVDLVELSEEDVIASIL